LQRRCHPPSKPEGKPCVGEPIITRTCNTDPCPDDSNKNKNSEENAPDLPLKAQIMRVSKRP